METVQRTLDYVLTARTPDLVGPLAGQGSMLDFAKELGAFLATSENAGDIIPQNNIA